MSRFQRSTQSSAKLGQRLSTQISRDREDRVDEIVVSSAEESASEQSTQRRRVLLAFVEQFEEGDETEIPGDGGRVGGDVVGVRRRRDLCGDADDAKELAEANDFDQAIVAAGGDEEDGFEEEDAQVEGGHDELDNREVS